MPIKRVDNLILLEELNQPTVGSDFIVLIKEILAEDYKTVKLDFSAVKRIFPNAAIPISTIIDYYTNEQNILFTRSDDNNRITERQVVLPLEVGEVIDNISHDISLNKVWKFQNSSDVNLIVDKLILDLRRSRQFEPGFLDSLTWSLNEVMDNVLQHSSRSYGFVMGQIHRQRKHIAFCVGDNGLGIYNSLKDSIHKPKTPIEALKIAVQESVTRDKKVGQGNGMYGLHQIVKFNKGRLTIISNTAFYKLEDNVVTTLTNIPTISYDNGGTIVDFQLHYENRVSIEEALIFNGIPHKNYVNYYLENLENEEGDLVYSLKEWRDGVGTRPSGKKLRLEILNNYMETKRRFVIDFKDLSVVSSSFADELLGKLVVEFGFFNFNNLVKLKNMNSTIQQIVQRSVAQRMAESLNNIEK